MVGAKKLSSSAETKPSSVSGKDKVSNGEELVGLKVKVWWPIDRKFYNGVVDSFNPRTKKHRVFYDDGEKEILDMSKERWELVDENDDDDNNADEDKSGDEIADAIPEPTNSKSARKNGVMGDIGGKMVAAASRLRSCTKIPEATNGKKKRAVSKKVRKPVPSSKKSKRKRTDDEDVGDDVHASDDESKPLKMLVDKLKGKKKKTQEKGAPKEQTKEGEPKEEAEEGEEPKEETKEGEPKEETKEGEPKEEAEEGEEAKEEEEEGEQA